MGNGHQKGQAMISVPLLPAPILQGNGRGAGNGVNDGSCLPDEVSIKIPKVRGLESFQVGGHMHIPGG